MSLFIFCPKQSPKRKTQVFSTTAFSPTTSDFFAWNFCCTPHLVAFVTEKRLQLTSTRHDFLGTSACGGFAWEHLKSKSSKKNRVNKKTFSWFLPKHSAKAFCQGRLLVCRTLAGKKNEISQAQRSRLFLAVEGGSGFGHQSIIAKPATSKNTNKATYAGHGRARKAKWTVFGPKKWAHRAPPYRATRGRESMGLTG